MVSLVRAGLSEGLKTILRSNHRDGPVGIWNKFLVQFWLLETNLEIFYNVFIQLRKTWKSTVKNTSYFHNGNFNTIRHYSQGDSQGAGQEQVKYNAKSFFFWLTIYEVTLTFWIQILYKTIYNRLKPVGIVSNTTQVTKST